MTAQSTSSIHPITSASDSPEATGSTVTPLASTLSTSVSARTTAVPTSGPILATQSSTPTTTVALPTAPKETTCRASQFALGRSVSAPGAATRGSQVLFQKLQFRNTGSSCVIALPSQIAVQSESGLTRTVATVNSERFTAYAVRHGQTRTITVGGSWKLPQFAGTAPCHAPVTDVDEVLVPLRAGDVRITVTESWDVVCTTPASTTITLDAD